MRREEVAMLKPNAAIVAIAGIAFVCVEAIDLLLFGMSTTSVIEALFSIATFALLIFSISRISRHPQLIFKLPVIAVATLAFVCQLIINLVASSIGNNGLIAGCVASILVLAIASSATIATSYAAVHAQKIESETRGD